MKTFKYAFVRSVPIMAGYIVLGLGFGVLLQSKGYGAGWALAMGGLIYAGSMQYVTIDLLAGGASLISAALMTLMVNAGHLFYGISMLERYKNTGAAKPYLIFALTDETYSVVCSGDAPEGVDQSRYFFWVSLLDQFYWVVGCVAGALLGTAVSLFGMDAISGAMMKANLPLLLRKRNLVKHLRSDSTRKKLRDALEKELSAQDSVFQQQVVTGFSRSFKTYLNGIAQAAEIPIE